jgi:hypothetical protein
VASPRGLAVDGRGHLLTADPDNNRVLVVAEKDARPYGHLSFEDISVDRYRPDPEIYTRRCGGRSWARYNERTGKKDTFNVQGGGHGTPTQVMRSTGACCAPAWSTRPRKPPSSRKEDRPWLDLPLTSPSPVVASARNQPSTPGR